MALGSASLEVTVKSTCCKDSPHGWFVGVAVIPVIAGIAGLGAVAHG
jgi:hypothetical protein